MLNYFCLDIIPIGHDKGTRDYICLIIYFYELSFNSLRPSDVCVGSLTIIGSDNGLSPGRRQAIFWINAVILFIGPLGTNFNEILITSVIWELAAVFSRPQWVKYQLCFGVTLLRNSDIARCVTHTMHTTPAKKYWLANWMIFHHDATLANFGLSLMLSLIYRYPLW